MPNPLLGEQATGGSTWVRADWSDLRRAAATARAVLVQAAAKKWNVDPAGCSVTRGTVTHGASGRTPTYASLVPFAVTLPLPKEAPLKDPKAWTLIGTSQKRLDTPDKVRGKTVYGIDVQVPGSKIGTVALCPVLRGKLARVADDAARADRGGCATSCGSTMRLPWWAITSGWSSRGSTRLISNGISDRTRA
jgi:isoquinoline 1-oxidoreductase subunit beta